MNCTVNNLSGKERTGGFLENPFYPLVLAAALLVLAFAALPLAGCGTAEQPEVAPSTSASEESAAIPAPDEAAEDEQQAPAEPAEPAYPTGWLIVPAAGVEAGVPVEILHLPGMDATPHIAGKPASPEELAEAGVTIGSENEDSAVIRAYGQTANVDPALLLVNLPDVLPAASYDVVYSYACTSASGGWEIPGITGERLSGYADGRQYDNYLARSEFVVPCAYTTAMKLLGVNNELATSGYRLLIYDVYRPMTAQYELSDAFAGLCEANPDVVDGLGAWDMGWYVAYGASGHNYGTDVDAGVCALDGTPVALPSTFDAFDESGHLTDYPMDASEISPEYYRAEIGENDACLALHRAFVNHGFTELASEWWHFEDNDTATTSREFAGDAGLDFTATLD